jgi:transcriptional regulatory protein LevR
MAEPGQRGHTTASSVQEAAESKVCVGLTRTVSMPCEYTVHIILAGKFMYYQLINLT